MWKNIYNQAELQIALDPKQGGLQGSSGLVGLLWLSVAMTTL
jgi:hypothetical protein